MINERIFLGFPIKFKDVCQIYPPTVNDVCGDDDFAFCQTLFTISQEDLEDAYVEENVYLGANQLSVLVAIKSKKELLGDLIALLQSPAKNVVSAVQSSGSKIHGILTTLEKRG